MDSEVMVSTGIEAYRSGVSSVMTAMGVGVAAGCSTLLAASWSVPAASGSVVTSPLDWLSPPLDWLVPPSCVGVLHPLHGITTSSLLFSLLCLVPSHEVPHLIQEEKVGWDHLLNLLRQDVHLCLGQGPAPEALPGPGDVDDRQLDLLDVLHPGPLICLPHHQFLQDVLILMGEVQQAEGQQLSEGAVWLGAWNNDLVQGEGPEDGLDVQGDHFCLGSQPRQGLVAFHRMGNASHPADSSPGEQGGGGDEDLASCLHVRLPV